MPCRPIILALLIAVLPAAASAQTPAQAPAAPTASGDGVVVDTKIGFVDTGAVLQTSDEGKQSVAAIEADAAGKATELETRGQELQDLRAVFNQQAASMNASAQGEAQNTIAQKERELTRLQEDFNAEVGLERDQLLGRMADSIRVVVAEYAKENGYQVVFILGPAMPFVGTALNITDQIIERYNQKFPVAAPPG